MSVLTGLDVALVDSPPTTFWGDARRRFVSNKPAVVSFVVLMGFVLVAIFANLLERRGFNDLSPDLRKRPLDSRWWLGTDSQGRDLFTRLGYAIRTSLTLGFTVAVSSVFVGVILGGIAGWYVNRWPDQIISRLIDMFFAIPYIIIGIAMISIFGSSFKVVVLSLVITGWYSTARVFRAAVLQVRFQDYIEAARATGAGSLRIFLTHVLPNSLPVVIVTMAFSVSSAILTESIFSFLGIGFIEPKPTLGVMIRNGRGYLTSDPHILFVPSVTLMVLTLAIVIIGDALRDSLDPRLRGSN